MRVYAKMKFVVTGGAGFIGSHVADELLADGHRVIVVDDLSTGERSNVSSHVHSFVNSDCSNIPLDLLDSDTVIIHCAAQPKCNVSLFTPERDAVDNYLPGLRLLTKAIRAGVRRLVIVSSMSVYGDARPLPFREEMDPLPKDPYAIHKFALEQIASLECSLARTEIVIVRPQHVFGTRQRSDLSYRNVVARWTRRALAGERLPVFGDLDLARAFSPVSLVARGILSASTTRGIDGEIINLGSEKVRSLREIATLIQDRVGVEIRFEFLKKPPTLEPRSYGSVKKASELLGVSEADQEFEENLDLLIQQIKSRPLDVSETKPDPELMESEFHQIYKS